MNLGTRYRIFSLFLIIILSFLFTSEVSAQTSFNGAGDGTSWDDAGNWDAGIPTAVDHATIPDGFTVVINDASVAHSVRIDGTSTLTVQALKTLTITSNGTEEGIDLRDTSQLINLGTIDISVTGNEEGIRLKSPGAILDNRSIIIISSTDKDGIEIDDGTVINRAGATITITDTGDDNNGILVSDTKSKFENSGTITITIDGGDGGKGGVNVEKGGSFTNVTTASILNITTGHNGIFLDKDNSIVTNRGTITITTPGRRGIEMEDMSMFNNLEGGKLTINDPAMQGINTEDSVITNFGNITINRPNDNSEGIRLGKSGAKLDNHKTIVITGDDGGGEGVELDDDTTFTNHEGATLTINTTGDEGIEMDDAIFVNSGMVNVNNPGRFAIELENGSGEWTNTYCAILNVIGEEIKLNTNATLTNEGIIASDFGPNENDGTFTNNGVIHAPGGVFDVSPNPLEGTGVVIDGPIPATRSLCSEACCFPDATCQDLIPADCEAAGGTPQGYGTDCVTSSCRYIPTITHWGLMAAGVMLGLIGFLRMRRSRNG
ncbi:MAG: hypothetical protein JRK53_19450 [Deltaproteobacteria bacterium]|nr:hypothetical protein [Deltaproteobacteria bacterium]